MDEQECGLSLTRHTIFAGPNGLGAIPQNSTRGGMSFHS